MSRLLNNQPRQISIYRLQRRPSFGFESSVSSTPMTSGDPVVAGLGGDVIASRVLRVSRYLGHIDSHSDKA